MNRARHFAKSGLACLWRLNAPRLRTNSLQHKFFHQHSHTEEKLRKWSLSCHETLTNTKQNREQKESVEFGNQLHTYLKLTLPSPYTALDWWWEQDASAPHSPSLTAKRSCKGSCCRSVSPPAKLDLFQLYVWRPLVERIYVKWCCWNVFKDGIICEVGSFCSCLWWLAVCSYANFCAENCRRLYLTRG